MFCTAVYETGERFGIGMVILVLKGSGSSKLKEKGLSVVRGVFHINRSVVAKRVQCVIADNSLTREC